MSTFIDAIDTVLAHEGGFADDPNDPGGATNYGISLRWLRREGIDLDMDDDDDVDVIDVRQMPRSRAVALYREHWWKRYRYHRLEAQTVATKVFDLAVNMGHRQAVRILQRALQACRCPVIVDGILGSNTTGAANELPPARMLPAIRSEAAGFYRLLIGRNAALRDHGIDAPDFRQYERGWLRRAYD